MNDVWGKLMVRLIENFKSPVLWCWKKSFSEDDKEKELPVMHPLTSWRDDGSFIDFFFCFTVIIIWWTLQIYYRFLWKSSSLLWRETFLREIIWFDVIVWFLFQTFRIRLFSQKWTNRVYIGSANYELEHTTGPK